MIRKNITNILLTGMMLVAILMGTNTLKAQEKPNVIVILTDDQGYGDVGFNGCKDIPTPNIDRIAQNGVKFTNGYVTYAVCGPSRAGIITGRYQDRFGFGRNPLCAPRDTAQGLPSTEETLAKVLSRSAYQSMALGKWHLGSNKSQYPLRRGFDEFYGFLSGGHNYFPEKWTLNDVSEIRAQYDAYNTRLMQDDGRVDEKEYLTDALSREAVSFIERKADAPFFMYLAYNAPHTPLQATEKYLKRFSHIKNEKRRTYAAMVSAVDDGVGKVLDKLEELGINENTIVFFLSDNGGPEHDNASDNGELRDGKSSLYEGGIHVPFAMQWPAKIPAGMVYDKTVSSLDIFATVVAYAEATPKNKLDGVNLVPYINGENIGQPHKQLFWRKYDQKAYAARFGDHKLVKYKSVTDEIYNLKEDIGEKNSLALSDENHYSDMKSRYQSWESEMKDPVFFGLMEGEKYDKLHPERYAMLSPFNVDTLGAQVPDEYQLLWAEEFDQKGKPNSKYWSYEEGFVRNNELQWYQSDNANVYGGALVIEGRKQKLKNPEYKKNSKNWRVNRKYARYTSSSIRTKDKFSFQYGIIEVRAKIDPRMGMWPAIWTLGIDKKWPANGEIDIMEFYRHEGVAKILANAAWADSKHQVVWDSEKVPFQKFLEKEKDWAEKFHIWKMDWTEEYIRIYLDDELLNVIDLNKTICADGFNPFSQEHYILLNLAIGSNGGDPSETSFPGKYEVDYVRVYQKK
ncbi:sulfatase-like hydrolase/transferase [Labilibaculum antarcticum]|uniref:N-acetylgalactosamine 6-sulfate sulfatase n=1 Tax=Labilibaculum antarcticum TaxID=1717717 RepID=A0A1Y1CQ32_9BACT|nr:sulfatase-like hydrolase/transferase [Labilibaculum antarcticum]BAX82390.1 N-acetylgalactosamine 6-sulfate sulfatase [Labilibaculum antarcticum]